MVKKPEISGGYAESIIGGNPENYTHLEVEAVQVDDHGDIMALGSDPEHWPGNPYMYSVYARDLEGHANCIGDFHGFSEAFSYAKEITSKYGFLVPPLA